MELPDNRFIRCHSAATIRRVSHGVRHCLTTLNMHQHVQILPANDIHLVRDVSSHHSDIT